MRPSASRGQVSGCDINIKINMYSHGNLLTVVNRIRGGARCLGVAVAPLRGRLRNGVAKSDGANDVRSEGDP